MTDRIQTSAIDLRGIRTGLLTSGIAIAFMGIVCIAMPLWFTTPVEWIVGGMMVASGLVGVFHLVVGVLASLGMWRRSPADSDLEPRRGSLSSASVAERGPVWAVVLMQLLLGGALLGWPKQISPFLSLILMLAVAAEGAIILWLSFHFQGLATKISLWVAGGLSVAVAVAALYSWGSPNADHLVGTLIGVKLIMIGAIFLRIGWGASESDLRSAYVGLSSFQEEPTTGSIYAVYYGPAFHCGISIGDGYIVDYLTDGIVRCISWEEFLLGRRAMEWNYPDVAAGSSEEIGRFAKSLVGKFNPYDALRFNCENLAIYCRSVGTTTYSGFSQASVGVEFVRQRPLLGSMVQLLNRGASWFLYGAGGPFGKKIGFGMIRVTRALTNWVVARPLRIADTLSAPADVYMPRFEDRGIGS